MTKKPVRKTDDKIQVHIPQEAIQQALKNIYIPNELKKKKKVKPEE